MKVKLETLCGCVRDMEVDQDYHHVDVINIPFYIIDKPIKVRGYEAGKVFDFDDDALDEFRTNRRFYFHRLEGTIAVYREVPPLKKDIVHDHQWVKVEGLIKMYERCNICEVNREETDVE